MKRPEITWSILHPTPLDPEYVEKLVKKAEIYPVDSFEICGQCHTPYGGLDGLIDYREFPQVAASWDQDEVRSNQTRLSAILKTAHNAGKKVYLWHREVMLPPGLIKDLPELLDENGEFDLTGTAFRNLIVYKINSTFKAVPELDGIVLDWATDNAYWALYEGDEYATTSAACIVLTDGAVYKLVYESF